jgi:uncharacterized protein YuzE
MVKTDTLEGIVNDTFRFHYDLFADVLYLKLLEAEEVETVGNLTDDGDILLRDEASGRPVGLTVISWWKRFGTGPLPDSINEIQQRIEPHARQLAA